MAPSSNRPSRRKAKQQSSNRPSRRKAKQQSSNFQLPVSYTTEWPPQHHRHFDTIQKIGATTFLNYCSSLDIDSYDRPWREKTKQRTEWIARRSSDLFKQQRNEAGWRFGVENAIFMRFHAEVACPRCRARVWRSEIEASLDESQATIEGMESLAQRLETRKQKREPCTCPLSQRPLDIYGTGTNNLFEDRVQQAVKQDPESTKKLDPKEPDRVYGLRETEEFRKLLHCVNPHSGSNSQSPAGKGSIRTSPYTEGMDSLHFPFCIIEAKSEKSRDGFHDMMGQTSDPIYALLELQNRLYDGSSGKNSEAGPLVWFFSYRGDAWRVYGCYQKSSSPNEYETAHLWNGVIQSTNDVLQLLLIVDYVVDWARSIYRPSIMRQLKSIATGRACDEVSLIDEGDTLFLPRNDSAPMAPPIDCATVNDRHVDRHCRISRPLGVGTKVKAYNDHEINAIRAASLVEYRIVGLNISEINLKSFLELIDEQQHYHEDASAAARHVLDLFKRQALSLQITATAILDIEAFWTGHTDSNKANPSKEDPSYFYASFEFATFIDVRWNIIREMTYIAISERAYTGLVMLSGFPEGAEVVQSLSMGFYRCPSELLRTATSCLRSGSTDQTFLEAVSRSAFTLFPVVGDKTTQPRSAAYLGLRIVRRSFLRELVSEINDLEQCRRNGFKRTPETTLTKCGNQATTFSDLLRPYPDNGAQEQQSLSGEARSCIIRILESVHDISKEASHATDTCQRCLRNKGLVKEDVRYKPTLGRCFSDENLAFVQALDYRDGDGDDQKKQLCIYTALAAAELGSHFKSRMPISIVITELQHKQKAFRTYRSLSPQHFTDRKIQFLKKFHFASTQWDLPLDQRWVMPGCVTGREKIFVLRDPKTIC